MKTVRTGPATRMLSGLPRFQTYFDFRFCTGQHLRLATKLRPQWRPLKKFRHSIFLGTTGIYCTRVYPSSDGRGWRRKSAGQVSPQSGHQGGWAPPLVPPTTLKGDAALALTRRWWQNDGAHVTLCYQPHQPPMNMRNCLLLVTFNNLNIFKCASVSTSGDYFDFQMSASALTNKCMMYILCIKLVFLVSLCQKTLCVDKTKSHFCYLFSTPHIVHVLGSFWSFVWEQTNPVRLVFHIGGDYVCSWTEEGI